jgi:hypothetical protein
MLGWFRHGAVQNVHTRHRSAPVSPCSADSQPEADATYKVPSAPTVGDEEMAPPTAAAHRRVPFGHREVTMPLASPNNNSEVGRGDTAMRPGAPGGAYVHRMAPYGPVALTAYTRVLPETYTASQRLDTVGLFPEVAYTMLLTAHARLPFANTLCSQFLFW